MSWVAWLLVGLSCGVVLTVVAARWQIKRSMARQLAAERRARSAERMAEIGAMTSGLAHEIKNPLSTIGLNAQLLSEGIEELPQDRAPNSDERQRLVRRLASLRRETERLRGILQDFLTYAGEMRLDPREHDLNTLASELVDFFQPQAESQGVRLRSELDPRGVHARVDSALIKQAVLNLMLNAVQAMQSNSTGTPRELIIRTRTTVSAPDARDETHRTVELHVIDTGPGIAPELREKIFQPYFTTKAGGSGLGLATTRRVVEAHNGRIELHSDPGKGTDFCIVLPADRST